MQCAYKNGLFIKNCHELNIGIHITRQGSLFYSVYHCSLLKYNGPGTMQTVSCNMNRVQMKLKEFLEFYLNLCMYIIYNASAEKPNLIDEQRQNLYQRRLLNVKFIT